jgi:hypothetical protein
MDGAISICGGGCQMTFDLRKPWGWGILVLSMGLGCGEPQAPILGPNLVRNGTFESGLEGWWQAAGSTDAKALTSSEAADEGTSGLVLYNSTESWGSMVGQDTLGHTAGQTFHIYARLKGAKGGERVSFNFHGQSVDVVAEARWRTVSRMVLMPEISGDSGARISVITQDATVYVDNVSFETATVERGDADSEEDNLLLNGSFESDLGMWSFWTNSPEGTARTSPDERHSGYASLVLTRGAEDSLTTVKQSLPDPVAEREEYRIEAHVRGANGGERVNVCLQINHEPWDGPCAEVQATRDWQHVSKKVPVEGALIDERVGLLVSLGSEGTAYVDDVIVVRTRKR